MTWQCDRYCRASFREAVKTAAPIFNPFATTHSQLLCSLPHTASTQCSFVHDTEGGLCCPFTYAGAAWIMLAGLLSAQFLACTHMPLHTLYPTWHAASKWAHSKLIARLKHPASGLLASTGQLAAPGEHQGSPPGNSSARRVQSSLLLHDSLTVTRVMHERYLPHPYTGLHATWSPRLSAPAPPIINTTPQGCVPANVIPQGVDFTQARAVQQPWVRPVGAVPGFGCPSVSFIALT